MPDRSSIPTNFSEFVSTAFDPANYFRTVPMLPVDTSKLMDVPRYNMNAMIAAVQSMNRGLESMLTQQTQMAHTMIDNAGKLAEAFRDGDGDGDGDGDSAPDVALLQTKVIRQSYDDTIDQMKALVDTKARVQSDLLDAMRDSVIHGLEETRAGLTETGSTAIAGEDSGNEAAARTPSGKSGGRSGKRKTATETQAGNTE